MKLFKNPAGRVQRVIRNILYTERGQIILSIILGLGLATLFRKMCKNKDCYRFIGPEQNKLRDQIFSYDTDNNKCYKLHETNVKCGSHKKTVDFA